MRGVILGVALIALAGCTAGAKDSLAALEAAQGDPAQQIQVLKEWKKADLAAASSRATLANDRIGALCYNTLLKYVGLGETVGASLQFAGAWDAFEAARLGIQAGTSGGLQSNPVFVDLQIGCGPLVGDIRLTLIKLGIMGGSTIMK